MFIMIQERRLLAAKAREALSTIIDPEAGINIVDMGLLRRVQLLGDVLHLDLTLTSPACPQGELIVDEVQATLIPLLPPGCSLQLELVWDPPWSPDDMQDDAKRRLGW